jgi:hypothetical protein
MSSFIIWLAFSIIQTECNYFLKIPEKLIFNIIINLETNKLWRFRFSLVNLQQQVAKIGFPPPLDVTRRTQGTQNSGEQQPLNRASSS